MTEKRAQKELGPQRAATSIAAQWKVFGQLLIDPFWMSQARLDSVLDEIDGVP